MIVIFVLCVMAVAGIFSWFVLGWLARAYQRYRRSFKEEAQLRLDEFFLFLDPTQLWGATIILCCILMTLAYAATGLLALSAAVGLAAFASPSYLIGCLKRRRLRRFDEQLPDLLLSLAGAMRAGSGLQVALRHIVAQSPVPLSQEFGLMLREQRMGLSLEQALANLYGRMPTEGAGLVASSLKIAAQSGGSLAETLDAIAATLRARLQLLGRIQALTSQGRMQAWVMACLPLALALALSYLDPDSMSALWRSALGWSVLVVIAALELTGIMFIRRIINIEV